MDNNNIDEANVGLLSDPMIEQVVDQSAEIDCSPTGGADFSTSPPAVPEEWMQLLDQQFAGKTFGLHGFGDQFKQGLLTQIASVKRVLESEAGLQEANQNHFTVAQIDHLIDICDTSGCPEKTSPYVKQMIILTVREDIGRAYLKGLQVEGEMMGISYAQLTAPPAPPVTEIFSEVIPTLT